jgi:hypothetical protein
LDRCSWFSQSKVRLVPPWVHPTFWRRRDRRIHRSKLVRALKRTQRTLRWPIRATPWLHIVL